MSLSSAQSVYYILLISILSSYCLIDRANTIITHDTNTTYHHVKADFPTSSTMNTAKYIMTNTLSIQSIGIPHAWFYVDENNIYRMVMQTGIYQLEVKLILANNEYIFSELSETAGICTIDRIKVICPLQQVNIIDIHLRNHFILVFNSSIHDLFKNYTLFSVSTSFNGLSPSADNTSIIISINGDSFPSTISCFNFDAKCLIHLSNVICADNVHMTIDKIYKCTNLLIFISKSRMDHYVSINIGFHLCYAFGSEHGVSCIIIYFIHCIITEKLSYFFQKIGRLNFIIIGIIIAHDRCKCVLYSKPKVGAK